MKKRYSILCFTLFLQIISYAQSFNLEQIMSSPFPENMTAAPVGARFAWTQNHEGKRNLWVAEGPDFIGKAITNHTEDDGQEIGNITFSPDGNLIAYVHGGGANRQGEIPNPTSDPDGAKQEIYLIPFAGGTPKLISDGNGPSFSPNGKQITFIKRGQIWSVGVNDDSKPQQLFTIRGSAGSLCWSPDGNKLAFTSNRGDHVFVGVYDLVKKEIQYLNPSVDRDGNPVWSPDGKKIAFSRIPNQKQNLPFIEKREGLSWSIMVHDFTKNQTKEIWRAKEGKGSNFWNISAGNQLFWSAGDQIIFPWEGDGWLHLYAVSADGSNARLLTPGNFEVQYVTMTPDGKAMVYSSNQDDIDRQHIWRVEIAGGAPKALTSGASIEWAPTVTADGTIAILTSSGTQPAQAMYLNGKGEKRQLAPNTLPKNFPSAQLVEPEQVIISAADGMQIHCQLFKPKNIKAGEKRPALLFFHGGSRRQMYLGFHDRGYYHNAYAMNQYLASKGYIVMSVNYRSGIGYGMEFREALNYGANGASEFNDVLGAGLYLRSRNDVDGTKIGLWGGSYGGYLTALGLAKASDLFAAGVDMHGVHDWNVVIRNFVPGYNPEQAETVARRAFESSPMAYLDGWRSPVLLIHGDDDRNVPFSETVDIAESLRRRNVYFEQLIFPDEVHGFLLHKNWLEAYKSSADFFDRMLINKKP
ncbi:MAG: prolyl oligopeptidase family serine peptidase [Saprospiraceae bacterium]|nr:prolyl oligopeptidase family serine peptidase [Saprospiraceae bacterium]